MNNNELIMKLMGMLIADDNSSKPSPSGSHPYEIGNSYHVRTVTYATAGKLKAIYDKELVFECASWVADTGRFGEYIKDTSKVSENEYLGEVIVSREAIVDVIEIRQAYDKTK